MGQAKDVNNFKDFEDVSGDDAIADKSSAGIRKLEERKREILSRTSRSDSTQSIRKGTLPPGVQMQTFCDEDGVWYYAVAVYSPSLHQMATDMADEMDRSTLASPASKKPIHAEGGIESDVRSPSKILKPLPTGSIGDDNDE